MRFIPHVLACLLCLPAPAAPPVAGDSDADGLPDAWERKHFGGLAEVPGGDFDQDGDTNSTELAGDTDPADIASNSGAAQAWQIDFQGGAGGAFGSADPATAAADLGYGAKWNAFQVPATNAEVFAKPPGKHNAVQDPVLENLADAAGRPGRVKLAVAGGVSAYNVARVLAAGGKADHAFGDHWFWGAQGRTSATLGFTFSNLPPGTYSLTAYANPDRHDPPRDFALTAGTATVPVRPVHGAGFYAGPGTFAGTIRGIAVDDAGTITGSLETLAGDPSIAAMVLRRTAPPARAER